MPNRLALEKSPYLLQHANNPVTWYPWGEEAFRIAREENKPIFLSIGYSTCHWCHVMERESFESESVAELLNRFFVPIKVDREERPDVDRIYMTFVQATTGSGGWPMSVWLTPDLKPFYGGTYFPPDSRYGRPGFRQLLEHLAAAWQNDREEILKAGDDVVEQLRTHVEGDGTQHAAADQAVFDSCYYQFRRAFDSRLGGFGGAPKFPRPAALNFLLRYGYLQKNPEATEMVVFTLQEMAKGGMHDHLGGGFHRYSVDARWFVPHFEKMLYDQAQLAVACLEAYQASGEKRLAEVARGIFEYVLRDMTDAGGGFYSAEDADSVIDPSNPHEKGEGAFYVWDPEEIPIDNPQARDMFVYRYGLEPNGNVTEDPHGEFTGKNILYERYTIADTARRFAVDEKTVERELNALKQRMLAMRSERIRPHLDDKVLTAWNGLMISAFAFGGRVLADGRYADAARRAVAFIREKLYVNGKLLRRWRDGEAAIDGFLDDYASLVQGLIDLYEATFEDEYLDWAVELTERMVELFEDREGGGFFSTAEGDASLVLRVKEDYDGAEPSGNSIAILNLLRLAHMKRRDEWREKAERALRAFGAKMATGPTSLPQMLVAGMYAVTPPKQIVLDGGRESMRPMLDIIAQHYLPFHSLMWSEKPGQAVAYVCENFTCDLPETDPQKLAELLQ